MDRRLLVLMGEGLLAGLSGDDDLRLRVGSRVGGGEGTERVPIRRGFLRLCTCRRSGDGVGVHGVSGARTLPERTGVESLRARGANVMDASDDAARCISSGARGFRQKIVFEA
jgi:hypothetical protein